MTTSLTRQTPAEKAAERDRVSALIIEQQRAQMLQKSARLRQLRLARDAQLPSAEEKEDIKVRRRTRVAK